MIDSRCDACLLLFQDSVWRGLSACSVTSQKRNNIFSTVSLGRLQAIFVYSTSKILTLRRRTLHSLPSFPSPKVEALRQPTNSIDLLCSWRFSRFLDGTLEMLWQSTFMSEIIFLWGRQRLSTKKIFRVGIVGVTLVSSVTSPPRLSREMN
jgi:hypothetical protein